MILTSLSVFIRIISNSYINVFQKILTNNGTKSSVVNFFTYTGLSILSLLILNNTNLNLSKEILINLLIMGFLGALGNYFIIKALSIGELSSIAPINSYKPIVAMIIGFLYLGEIPSTAAILGIFLIIFGTYFLYTDKNFKQYKSIFYRILALIFSGTEAIFIKKIIILSSVTEAFIYWAFSGFIFSLMFIAFSKNKLHFPNVKYQTFLILSVAIMQYTTNYVFSKINVSYALALFQLSTILSIFLGANIFKEEDFSRKIIASLIMLLGAVIILLS